MKKFNEEEKIIKEEKKWDKIIAQLNDEGKKKLRLKLVKEKKWTSLTFSQRWRLFSSLQRAICHFSYLAPIFLIVYSCFTMPEYTGCQIKQITDHSSQRLCIYTCYKDGKKTGSIQRWVNKGASCPLL